MLVIDFIYLFCMVKYMFKDFRMVFFFFVLIRIEMLEELFNFILLIMCWRCYMNFIGKNIVVWLFLGY